MMWAVKVVRLIGHRRGCHALRGKLQCFVYVQERMQQPHFNFMDMIYGKIHCKAVVDCKAAVSARHSLRDHRAAVANR